MIPKNRRAISMGLLEHDRAILSTNSNPSRSKKPSVTNSEKIEDHSPNL
jgi:hypothetical protein